MTTQTAELPPPASTQALRALISEAWAVTDVVADQVEPATREAAFKLVLEAMLRNGSTPPAESELELELDDDEEQDGEPEPGSIDVSLATPEQRAWAIADYLRIDIDQALCLYNVDDQDPLLRPPLTNLSDDCQAAVRELALLVAAGRSAVGLETGTEHIRAVVDALEPPAACGVLAVLEAMDELVVRGDPQSPNRLVRLRGIGVEAVRALAARIAAAAPQPS